MNFTDDDDPKFLQALGLVALNFSWLELSLEVALYGLMEPTPNVILFTSVMSFKQKVDVLAGLLAIKRPDLLGDGTIISKISQCEEKRNQVLHSWWPADDGVLYRASDKTRRKGGFRATQEPASPADMSDTATMIKNTQMELSDINSILRDDDDKDVSPTASPS